MFKRCIPIIMALILIGCNGSPPSNASNSSGAIVDSTINTSDTSDVSTSLNTVEISVGDYTAKIPASWTESNGYYYCSNVGEPPYMFVSVMDDMDYEELISDPDPFVSATVEGLQGNLLSDFMPVSEFETPMYCFTATSTIEDYQTLDFFYFFDNPSGGIVAIGFMSIDDKSDCFDRFVEMLESIKK